MKGLGWLKTVGKVVAYPVTKPVDLLSKRAGAQAVDGAVDRIESRVFPTVVRPTLGPLTWQDAARLAARLALKAVIARLRR